MSDWSPYAADLVEDLGQALHLSQFSPAAQNPGKWEFVTSACKQHLDIRTSTLATKHYMVQIF